MKVLSRNMFAVSSPISVSGISGKANIAHELRENTIRDAKKNDRLQLSYRAGASRMAAVQVTPRINVERNAAS